MTYPERDPQANKAAQGVYRKYRIERADGKPEKPGAEYFVLDAVNDKHALPALQAYAESCQVACPELSKDITRRWLMRKEPTTEGRKDAPSVARAVAPDRAWRKLRIGGQRLIDVGLSAEAAGLLCGVEGFVLWHELARRDGILALAVLEHDYLVALSEELVRQGVRVPLLSAGAIGHFIYTAAEQYSPRDDWYSKPLVSAVACSMLLRLAEDAWSYTGIVVARKLPGE